MGLNFLFQWMVCYILVMFAMSVDNIFWISSSAEYLIYKKLNWFKKGRTEVHMGKKVYYTKIGYIFKYRVWSVLSDWRDIIPGIITSIILAVFIGWI